MKMGCCIIKIGFVYPMIMIKGKPYLKRHIVDLFSIHPCSTKMYQDLKMSFWWSKKKRDISEFVT